MTNPYPQFTNVEQFKTAGALNTVPTSDGAGNLVMSATTIPAPTAVERQALWEAYYAQRFDILGSAATISAAGDPLRGAITAATYQAKRQLGGTGDQGIWTPNQPIGDMGITYIGPAEIPEITMDGVDDEFVGPAVAFFSHGNGTVDTPFSAIFICKPSVTQEVNGGLLQKWSEVPKEREWSINTLQSDASAIVFFLLDESTNGHRGRNTGAGALLVGSYNHILVTYNGDESSPMAGIDIFVNNVQKDTTDFTSGTYVAMEASLNADMHAGENVENTSGGGGLTGVAAGGPFGPVVMDGVISAANRAADFALWKLAAGV